MIQMYKSLLLDYVSERTKFKRNSSKKPTLSFQDKNKHNHFRDKSNTKLEITSYF